MLSSKFGSKLRPVFNIITKTSDKILLSSSVKCLSTVTVTVPIEQTPSNRYGEKYGSHKAPAPRVYLLCQYSEPEITLSECLGALKAYSLCERPETVDVSLKCKRKENAQQIRGTLKFPHTFGKGIKILAFAEEPQASIALKSGAIIAGGTELVKQIQNDGLPDVDMCVATPSMMSEVKKLQMILRAKMPIDRRGTVGKDLDEIIKPFLGSKDFKSQRNYVNIAVGKLDFTEDQIRDNIQAVIEAVSKHRDNVSKSNFIEKIVLSTTYGPGFKLIKDF